ncbi:MAG: hypothetical protein JWN11_618 [Hyphomicrobiales bacterium]|nr:hypothetical protein [Hyphomicrobiales bacterium]
MAVEDAYLAYSRFGLGPRPDDIAGLRGSAKAALIAEISAPDAALLNDPGLTDSVTAYAQIREIQKARKLARQAPAASDPSMAATLGPTANIDRNGKFSLPGVAGAQQLMQAEIAARLERIRTVPIGFVERLVGFWANHFAVQAASSEVVRGLAGAFEREAIRPHVLGRFSDMVLAATKHPAMLVSLNNATSIGPDSPQGQRNGKGLNENHARELMELHTIGVDAGYTQADVTAFAKILTGWSFGQNQKPPADHGRFTFHKQAHEPGPQTVMGKLYSQPGIGQGEAVIADLVANPATARHVADKLARYFVADLPDPALVDTLAHTFTRSKGDLRAVTLALLDHPASWAAPAKKLKTPQEFLWSAVRALELEAKPNFIVRTLADLGQPLWNPPSPQGFKDDAATWLAPDAMAIRVDTAELMAGQAKGAGDPRQLASDVLGPALSPETKTAIDRAESRGQALALLLMSPEFQRR